MKNALRKAERGSVIQVVLTPPAKLGLDGAGKEYTWLQTNKQKPTMGEETFFRLQWSSTKLNLPKAIILGRDLFSYPS